MTTSPLTQIEFVVLFFLVVVWYVFVPFGGSAGMSYGATPDRAAAARFYAAVQRQPLPPAVFGVAWFVLYGLVAAANFGYWRDATASSSYTTALALFIVNWLFNKIWTPVFFGARSPGGGLLVILVVLGTAVALLVLAAIDLGATYVAVFLGVYVAWLLVATLLNVYVLYVYSTASERADAPDSAAERGDGAPDSTSSGLRQRAKASAVAIRFS